MNRALLLTVCALVIAGVAMATDHIGIYSDATGTSCNIGFAGQFNPNATVIHKFATGATGSTFNITVPPGTAFFGFNSPFLPIPVVQPTGGISLGYGQCLTGNTVLGNINAIYATGTAQIVPADTYSNVISVDCSFVLKTATGGRAYVGTTGDCIVAVEPSTWGSVKALYR